MQTLFGMGLFSMLLMVIIWLAPVVLILRSDKTAGLEKLIWLGLIFFFSWFSWILYMILAPIDKRN